MFSVPAITGTEKFFVCKNGCGSPIGCRLFYRTFSLFPSKRLLSFSDFPCRSVTIFVNLFLSGLEHSLVPISLRERLSFTKAQTGELVRRILSFPAISGCVLLSTCNRTELYVTCEEETDPGKLLCEAAKVPYAPYQTAFVTLSNDEAVQHVMEVAAGLRSRIWGEDQILAQVKGAITLAREAGTTDGFLETLFRSAIAAGKEVRTKVHLTAVPASAARAAVDLLKQKNGPLTGKKALVIGNGEMGRLSASLLYQEGCQVTVTLRTYHHGETIVPPGCGVVPYDERFLHMNQCDILLSATTSPHYTVTTEPFYALPSPPSTVVDLAIPRDIQPEVGALPGVTLFNIDDLGDFSQHRSIPPEVTAILETQKENFYRWLHYKECMSSVDSLKQALMERLFTQQELAGDLSAAEVVEIAVDKTVDLLVSGLADRITSENLTKCESKIRLHTTGRPVIS